MNWDHINKHRVRTGLAASDDSYGFNGFFCFTIRGRETKVIISDGGEWKHVSVSHRNKAITPDWETMCAVKDIFFEPEECVVQYHPPRSQYVNHHPGCLHLWQPTKTAIPTPPQFMV